MKGTYRKNDKNMMEQKWKWINEVTERLRKGSEGEEGIQREFYHYTPLSNLFNILEGDSLWLSNMKFSNDDSEGSALGEDGVSELDNYIACFCDKGDRLSQWRGYCPQGGASIEFALDEIHPFSVLHADYDTSKKYEIYYNVPLPVMYVANDEHNLRMALDAVKKTGIDENGNNKFAPAEMGDIIPYLKNDKFIEERELRLAFVNWDESLYDCIRFRTLENGVKTPYIVVKIGNVGKNANRCSFDTKSIDKTYLSEKQKLGKNDIWIPAGSNQERMFSEVSATVQQYNTQNAENGSEPFMNIFCEGHLPIKKIIISPMHGQLRVAEQVRRYCYSKYWLRNVQVICSEIPYVTSLK